MRITVLGAGYMGTAMATVAKKRGHDVTLWGTWLDDPMLDPVERGEVHPRLKLKIEGIKTLHGHDAKDLERALAGAELVVSGVNSDGIVEVMKRAKPFVPNVPILSVTKGLLENAAGKMERIDLVVSEVLGRDARYVHAAGPAKAMEIARDVLTLMCFAGRDAELCAKALEGDRLIVSRTDDIAGAELCSALKNAYATGIGMWDGFVGPECHNARAASFSQAIVEMRTLVTAAGGRADTVHGAAGVGDLHVTAAAGRNRAFGERIGKGEPAGEVARDMLAKGQLTEGYMAITTAMRFAKEHGVAELPLLRAIDAVVWRGADVGETLRALRF
jgi:glycerol-3-phosphate dehydrogenase (NAD(P)+)